MDGSTRESYPGLRWSAIFGGAVVAIASAWAGELLGGLLSLIRPGESSAWGWIGAIVTLSIVVGGALAGGYLAARIGGAESRSSGLLHGLLVWGLFGTASATLFALLGGNLALVAGATAGAIRLAIGTAMLGMFGALLGAAAGGTLAAGTGGGAWIARSGSAGVRRPGRGAGRHVPVEAGAGTDEAAPTTVYRPPVDRGDGRPPPSVH